VGGSSGRWWWAATGIVLIVWALQLFNGVDEIPLLGAFVVFLVVCGLATLLASLMPTRSAAGSGTERIWRSSVAQKIEKWWRLWGRSLLCAAGPWAIAVIVVSAFVVWSFLQVRTDPTYSTDEVAFDQYAATLALHGSNPYDVSMEPAFNLYHLSPNGATFRLDGSRVTSLSYPALSFEIYLPFLALGWSTQLAVGINVISWAVAILLLFGMLPRKIRASALVIGSLSTYAGYAVGGITDALYVPLLLGAAFYWERSATERGRGAWVSPALFGLAMAVKQTPWLVLPFVLIGIMAEHRHRSGTWGVAAAGRYLAIAFGVFLVPNLPYLVGSPRHWLSGVLTPLASNTVPAGQGLIGVSLFLHIGGGSLLAYSVATLVALVALCCTYAASYPLLRGWTFVLPSIVLFFAVRSFGSYLVMLAPVAYLAVASTFRDDSDRMLEQPSVGIPQSKRRSVPGKDREPWRYWPVVAVGGAVATGAAAAVALLSAPPLTISVTNVQTTGQLATVERISVAVHNNTSTTLTPSFTIESGGVITAFWRSARGGSRVPAHATSQFTLLSPNFGAQPAISGGFSVAAFTSSPATVSASDAFLPSTWHVALTPNAISKPVALGQPVTVQAELLDRLDRRVRVSEIPIYLGQIIYDQRGLLYSAAVVNGSPPGRTPVEALTNNEGLATFVIQGTQETGDPVYFEANLVNFSHFYPYGYSDILLIRFANSL
jgi:hypothetical protein